MLNGIWKTWERLKELWKTTIGWQQRKTGTTVKAIQGGWIVHAAEKDNCIDIEDYEEAGEGENDRILYEIYSKNMSVNFVDRCLI